MFSGVFRHGISDNSDSSSAATIGPKCINLDKLVFTGNMCYINVYWIYVLQHGYIMAYQSENRVGFVQENWLVYIKHFDVNINMM